MEDNTTTVNSSPTMNSIIILRGMDLAKKMESIDTNSNNDSNFKHDQQQQEENIDNNKQTIMDEMDDLIEGTLLDELYRKADTEVFLQGSGRKFVTPQQKAEIRMVLIFSGLLLPRSRQAKYYYFHVSWYYAIRIVCSYCCTVSLVVLYIVLQSISNKIKRDSNLYLQLVGDFYSYLIFYLQIIPIIIVTIINSRRLNQVCRAIDIWSMLRV